MGLLTGLIVGLSAYSAYQQWRAGDQLAKAGEQQQRAAESAAEMHEWNAEVADLQAADAVERGQQEENRFRSSVRGIIGSQRAAMAAGNVDVGFGSALDVQADAAYLGELDALTIRSNAAREAWGYKVEAFDAKFRAAVTREEGAAAAEAGRVARTNQRIGAVGTVLGSGVSLVQARYGANSGRGTTAT